MGHSAAHARARFTTFVLGGLLAAFLFTFLAPTLPTVQAQDEAAAGENKSGDAGQAKTEAKPKGKAKGAPKKAAAPKAEVDVVTDVKAEPEEKKETPKRTTRRSTKESK